MDFRQLDALKPMLAERIAHVRPQGVRRGRTRRHRQLRPAVHHRLPADPRRRAELPGLGVQRDAPGRDDRAVEELALPVLVGPPVRGRRGGRGVLRLHAVLRGPAARQPPVRDHLHRPARRDARAAGTTSAPTGPPRQPTGKWVGEAEYSADHYVCNPGQRCSGPHAFAAFCQAVWAPPDGFAAVKFDVNLDGGTFFPCPRGTLNHGRHLRHKMHRRPVRHDKCAIWLLAVFEMVAKLTRRHIAADQGPSTRPLGGPGRPAGRHPERFYLANRPIAVTVADASPTRLHRSVEMITRSDISSFGE